MVSALIKFWNRKHKAEVDYFYAGVRCCQAGDKLYIWGVSYGVYLAETDGVQLNNGAIATQRCPFKDFLGVNGVWCSRVKEIVLSEEIAGTNIPMLVIFPNLERISRRCPEATIVENNTGVCII